MGLLPLYFSIDFFFDCHRALMFFLCFSYFYSVGFFSNSADLAFENISLCSGLAGRWGVIYFLRFLLYMYCMIRCYFLGLRFSKILGEINRF